MIHKIKNIIEKYSPIYINTLNIFRPFKTWLYNIIYHWSITSHKIHVTGFFKARHFDWLQENFYTYYWWEHPQIWNFEKKWVIMIFEDVQYKHTYGMRELETCPFVLIRIFNWNLLIKINDHDYRFWESQYSKC